MKYVASVALLCALVLLCSCGGGSTGGGGTTPPPPVVQSTHTLLAWSELGMHCLDGKDYSIFGVLPPYNVVRAQAIKRGNPPQLVTTGVTLTYEATKDDSGSINTISSTKTNFWTYAQALFLQSLALDVGLAGKPVQSLTPEPLDFSDSAGYWQAEGIPTVPYDDDNQSNAYPMAKVVLRNSSGTLLSSARIVLSVSDEMTCKSCHASNSNPAAQPAAGWVQNPDVAKDTKFNILRLHDQRSDVSAYLAALAAKGYPYTASLYDTALSGTPILCDACHASNALPGTGVAGVAPLTQSMHTLHGGVVYPPSGTTLDNATSPFSSCYLCHPGVTTKCQRGAMNSITCQSCHGNLTRVGSSAREGWLDVPNCQLCHADGNRYFSAFDTTGQWRVTADATFATNSNTPAAGKSLYRFSRGHGQLYCSGCHGSPHAEFPTLQPNDNDYSMALQGYTGMVAECTTCHNPVPLTNNGGPHGLHTIGQAWVDRHHESVSNVGAASCVACHGANYRGTFLSRTRAARTFQIEGGNKVLAAGYMVSCYDCHNGPSGD